MQENLQKYQKTKQLEAIGARWATWWRRLAPPWCRPAWHFKCHLTNPWEMTKKHISKPSLPLIPNWCMINLKRAITWIADSPSGMSGAQMDKCCSYPHSTTPLGPPHHRRRAHSTVALRPGPPPRRPVPHFHSTASPSDTCKETHLGATWSIDLWLFKVGVI